MAEEKVPFKRAQVKLAVSALLTYINKEGDITGKKKSELFESRQGLWLSVGLRKIPATQVKPTPIPLPHPLHESSDVCFISSQPGKVMRKIFEEKGITNIEKVISLTKLRKEYKTYTLKRQLISSYNIFLCEEKIYHLVCKSLGKECYKHKKEPVPVRTVNKDLKKEIEKCLSSTMLRVGHGPSSSILVGQLNEHKEKQMVENLLHAMRIVGQKVPGKWNNIKSMYLKTSTSVALPLYQASPVATHDLSDVKVDVEEKQRKRKRKATPSIKNTNLDEVKSDDEGQNEDQNDKMEDVVLDGEKEKEVTPLANEDIEETNPAVEKQKTVVAENEKHLRSSKVKKAKVEEEKEVGKLVKKRKVKKVTTLSEEEEIESVPKTKKTPKKTLPAKKTGPRKVKSK